MVINARTMEGKKHLIPKNGAYVLSSPGHHSEIMNEFNEQRRRHDKSLCDVTLSVEGKRLLAHKAVLAACSEYFKNRFTGEDCETRPCKRRRTARSAEEAEERLPCQPNTPLFLPGMKLPAFAQLLNYMYTSRLHIRKENVYELLLISCLLQVRDVVDACLTILSRETKWQMPRRDKKQQLVINDRSFTTRRSSRIKPKQTSPLAGEIGTSPSVRSADLTSNSRVRNLTPTNVSRVENGSHTGGKAMSPHPQSSSAPPVIAATRSAESSTPSKLTSTPPASLNAVDKRRQYVDTQHGKLTRSAAELGSGRVADAGSDPARRTDTYTEAESRDFTRSPGSRSSPAVARRLVEKIRRNRTVSEGPQVDCHQPSTEHALDLRRHARPAVAGPHRDVIEQTASARRREFASSRSPAKQVVQSADSVNVMERKRKISRGSFHNLRQARSNSDADLHQKSSLSYGPYTDNLPSTFGSTQLYEQQQALLAYGMPRRFDYGSFLLDRSYTGMLADSYSLSTPFSTIPPIPTSTFLSSSSSPSPLYPDLPLAHKHLSWPFMSSLFATGREAAERQSHNYLVTSKHPEVASLDPCGSESPRNQHYDYSERSLSRKQKPFVTTRSPPPYRIPGKHYDVSCIKHVRKRKLMAALPDSGTETERAVSVDSNVAGETTAANSYQPVRNREDLPPKAAVAMMTSVVGDVHNIRRCDPLSVKEPELNRHQQCVM